MGLLIGGPSEFPRPWQAYARKYAADNGAASDFRDMLAKGRGLPEELGKGDLCRCKANWHRLTRDGRVGGPKILNAVRPHRPRRHRSACEERTRTLH